jgi:cell division protein FtsW
LSRKLTWDLWIFGAALCLTVFGTIMVGSASSFVAAEKFERPSHFLIRQILYALVGLALMLLVMRLPHRWLARREVVLGLMTLVSVLLVVALLSPPINNAHRWIPLGPIHVQPSELAKIVLVIMLAYLIERKGERINEWSTGLVPCLAVAGLFMGLVIVQPDFGTTAILGLIAFTMLFVAGLRWRYLLITGGTAAAVLAVVLVMAPYRVARLLAFAEVLAKGLEAEGKHTYQLVQSLVAMGSGGVGGTSLAGGYQKAFFLPEPFTDFIYAVIGEELGLMGCALVLAIFLVLLWRGLQVSSRCEDVFGSYLALGLTALLVGQALVNMGVVVGLLPTKGLPLPFISYGGSSLVCSLAAVGLLLSVSRGRA